MADTPIYDDDEPTAHPTPWPFIIAFGLIVIVGFLAYRFLSEDDLRLVAPDRIQVTGDDELRLEFNGPFTSDVVKVASVGFAVDDDTIQVELALEEQNCAAATCTPVTSVDVRVTLPIAIDGRNVVAGSGRSLLACEPADDGLTAICGESDR